MSITIHYFLSDPHLTKKSKTLKKKLAGEHNSDFYCKTDSFHMVFFSLLTPSFSTSFVTLHFTLSFSLHCCEMIAFMKVLLS